MRDNRRFLRVNYLATGWLHQNDSRYNCRLENISKNGALVSLIKAPDAPIHPDDKCTLMLYKDDSVQRYEKFGCRIVRFGSGMAALEFIESMPDSLDVLDKIIQKELDFINGGKKLIDLCWEFAELTGVELTALNFDRGELNPEREMQTLRLSAGELSVNVHLHREEIEAFYARNDSEQAGAKIYHAIERLGADSKDTSQE